MDTSRFVVFVVSFYNTANKWEAADCVKPLHHRKPSSLVLCNESSRLGGAATGELQLWGTTRFEEDLSTWSS